MPDKLSKREKWLVNTAWTMALGCSNFKVDIIAENILARNAPPRKKTGCIKCCGTEKEAGTAFGIPLIRPCPNCGDE